MQKFFTLMLAVAALMAAGCTNNDSADHTAHEVPQTETAALQKENPVGKYGEQITLTEVIPVSQILESPETYQGKRVLISGDVVDVCARRGCWIEVAGDQPYQKIQVKVNDGEIVFPLSAKGNLAVVEGTVEKLELSEEQARQWKAHQAEERGETFDPESIQGPLTIWRIRGIGAEIKG